MEAGQPGESVEGERSKGNARKGEVRLVFCSMQRKLVIEMRVGQDLDPLRISSSTIADVYPSLRVRGSMGLSLVGGRETL